MPKIHKKDNLLRPVVDYMGSIGYNVSRALADPLAPLVGTTVHHTKNSKDPAKELSTVIVRQGDIFNSHDIGSLFTNTPIEQTLAIIQDMLQNDKKLKLRTKLDIDDIMSMLQIVAITMYFSFRYNIYYQKFLTNLTNHGEYIYGMARGKGHCHCSHDLYAQTLEEIC